MGTSREGQAQLATWISLEAMQRLRTLRDATGEIIGELVTAAVMAYEPKGSSLADLERRLASLEQKVLQPPNKPLDQATQTMKRPSGSASPLTDDERALVLRLHQEGLSHREIAQRIGRSKTAVQRVIARG